MRLLDLVRKQQGLITMTTFPSDNDAPPPLNSAHVVNKIVRKFASDVIKHTFADAMSREQFVTWITDRVKALRLLFLGEFTLEANQYHRGVWNTPDNLGRYLQDHMPQDLTDDPVTTLFNTLAGDVMKIVKNTRLSEQDSKNQLEARCNATRDLLLGLGIQNHQ